MKAKFEGSFEERYNRYWNICVVPSDATIRKNLGFFRANPDAVNILIAEYVQHIMNILNNLHRQYPMFVDADYVSKYIQRTQTAAVADLMLYRKSLKAADMDLTMLEQYILEVQGKDRESENTMCAL